MNMRDDVSILPLSTNCQWNFGTVPTVWYFFSILFFIIYMMAQQCFHVTDDPYINDSPLHGMALLNVRVPVFINL